MKTYLGDGLYADYDGWQIELSTERAGIVHRVYLEPAVYWNLVCYHKALMDVPVVEDDNDAPPPVEGEE